MNWEASPSTGELTQPEALVTKEEARRASLAVQSRNKRKSDTTSLVVAQQAAGGPDAGVAKYASDEVKETLNMMLGYSVM